MKSVTHEEQQKAWDEEHKKPQVLKQMDSEEASSGVINFFEFLQRENSPHRNGLEMGCGKGRNVIWLAKNGVAMTGFDFSPAAIAEAKRRAEGTATDAEFIVADATEQLPFADNSFDFGIDCFASTDIESEAGRKFAISEMFRVMQPGGLFLAYLLSIDDEFHKEMMSRSPSAERNSFVHPTGKFEKTYDETDIATVFSDFEVVKKERRAKKATFGDKEYACNHFWLVLRKPSH